MPYELSCPNWQTGSTTLSSAMSAAGFISMDGWRMENVYTVLQYGGRMVHNACGVKNMKRRSKSKRTETYVTGSEEDDDLVQQVEEWIKEDCGFPSKHDWKCQKCGKNTNELFKVGSGVLCQKCWVSQTIQTK
ncbi:hypothetical protein [Methanolapillus millepedarum]|uniref:hypothetical protein n=1 Tax=Methanolapillus millepedarum TaxID=3028296 RepID=UPI0030B8CDD5